MLVQAVQHSLERVLEQLLLGHLVHVAFVDLAHDLVESLAMPALHVRLKPSPVRADTDADAQDHADHDADESDGT